jgi:hypothetical protein
LKGGVLIHIQRKEVDWNEIRTEYITTQKSYTDLSKKYGVNRTTIGYKAAEEGWVALREQHQAKALTRTLKEIEKNQSKRMVKVFDLTDKVLDTLIKAISGQEGEEARAIVLMDPKKVTGAIKDIKEIYMFKSAGDLEEQEARINKLRKEAEKTDDIPEIEINIKGADESWLN